MRKLCSCILFCLVVSGSFWITSVVSDRTSLSRDLIRMHVVANSNSIKDQEIKLMVRDAVLASMENDLKNIQNMDLAIQYLEENIYKLQNVANNVLKQAGMDMSATVSLGKELFPLRQYDTFRLPSGIYETLKITIGEGSGENWWCVAFPAFCMQSSEYGFQAAAAGAGFSESLTESLLLDTEYEIRFYLMDLLGKISGLTFQ